MRLAFMYCFFTLPVSTRSVMPGGFHPLPSHRTVCRVLNRARMLSCAAQPTCYQPTRLCAKYSTGPGCYPAQHNQLAISLVPLHAPTCLPTHFAVTLPCIHIDPGSLPGVADYNNFCELVIGCIPLRKSAVLPCCLCSHVFSGGSSSNSSSRAASMCVCSAQPLQASCCAVSEG